MSENFYESEDSGCCLICPDAHDGCLCYDCKCSQCTEYEPEGGYDDEGNEKGYCTIAQAGNCNTPSHANIVISQITPDSKGMLKCRGCPCLFFSKPDLIKHIRKFSINNHDLAWKREHAHLDGHWEE